MKRCCACKLEKNESEFSCNCSRCKSCSRQAGKIYRESGRKKPNSQQTNSKYNTSVKGLERSRKFKELNRLACCLRTRISDALSSQKVGKYFKLKESLGCSIQELKIYLESKFTEGMTWENYGFYGWHVDHVVPCAFFDLSDPEQQQKCFHYTNLQPLWRQDNLKKGSKIVSS